MNELDDKTCCLERIYHTIICYSTINIIKIILIITKSMIYFLQESRMNIPIIYQVSFNYITRILCFKTDMKLQKDKYVNYRLIEFTLTAIIYLIVV